MIILRGPCVVSFNVPVDIDRRTERPDVDVLRASIPFSYGLSIFDHDRAGITIFTEQGIAGLIVNDTDDALSWAEKQYERVK